MMMMKSVRRLFVKGSKNLVGGVIIHVVWLRPQTEALSITTQYYGAGLRIRLRGVL